MSENMGGDFDLQVRELLKDAREEVPASVWKAVSSRLEQNGAVLWWRRAGWAFAMAAMFAVALILIMPGSEKDRTSQEPRLAGTSQATPQAVPQEPVEEFVQESTMLADATETVNAASQESRPAGTSQATPQAAPQEPVEEFVQESTMLADATETVSGETSPTVCKDKKAEERTDDASSGAAVISEDRGFHWAEDTDGKSGRKPVSISLNGSFAANKSSVRFPTSTIMGSPTTVNKGINEVSESRLGIPFSVGIGVRWTISPRLFIGTGIDYSLLTRRFTGDFYPESQGSPVHNADIFHSLSYVGIPLNVYFAIIDSTPVCFYAYGGAEVERAVANRYNITQGNFNAAYKENVNGVQMSAQLGLGVEFRLTDFLGLYIDPAMKFYFDCSQPRSVRTLQPLMFTAEAGLRFNLKK